MMSDAWFQCPHDAWPLVAEALPLPWPDAAVDVDLAWWSNEGRLGRDRPSRRCLSARWGWSDWRVRRALRALPLPNPSQTPPKPLPTALGQTPDIEGNSPKPLPNPSQTPPHARSRRTKNEEQEILLRSDFDRVVAAWHGYRRACGVTPRGPKWPGMRNGPKSAQWFRARAKEGPEVAIEFFTWLTLSTHHRARFYRENAVGISTVMDKWDELMEISQAYSLDKQRPKPAQYVDPATLENREADRVAAYRRKMQERNATRPSPPEKP